MTFKIIVPSIITDDEIDAKSIATETAYNGATEYSSGDIVLASDGNIYEYVGATSSSTDDPTATGAQDWVDLGPPNYLRPFDVQVGVDQARVIETQAEDSDEITYTISGLGAVLGAAFLNMQAQSVGLTVTSSGGSTGDTYDDVYELQDEANVGTSEFRWMRLPINRERNYVLTDLYWPAGSSIDVDIDNTGGTAKVGAIVFGLVQDLDATLDDSSWELKSRSFKSFDGYKTSLVRRFPGGGINIPIKLTDSSANAVRRVLEDIDGIACVFAPSSDHPELTVYGVLQSVQLTARAGGHTFLNLRVEAI